MKLAVINFSGNVGKSTVARHLLAARIPGCQVIAVESINAQDSPMVTIRGRQFAELRISAHRGHPFQRNADSVSDERGHHFRLNADSVSN